MRGFGASGGTSHFKRIILAALLRIGGREAGVEAYADVYHTDIHSFDMLYPKMDISVEAIGNFNEHFAYAVERYRAPQS